MTRPAICRSSLLACFIALASLPSFSQSVTISPTSISFGNQAQGTASSVHKLTLKNAQSSAITISGISTNLADFSQANNCPVSPATLATLGTCTISITFTPSAQGTRSGTLTVADSGLSSPQLASLTGVGTAPVLLSIAVTPSTASVAAGNTQQFTATGTYSDGSTQNLTTTASWTSSKTSVATVGLHTGLTTSVAAGTATITATSGTITGSATLTVTAAVLTSISVTPTTASVAAGKTQQFTATGTYSNGTTQVLTSTSTWKSSATSVATVSSVGLATSVAAGTATITATSGSISGSATLTATAAVLTSIAVTPTTASVAAGNSQQFTATGTYSNGTTQVLTTATWKSSAASVATVNSAGLSTSVATGTASITATSGTISGSATLTVTAAVLTSIAVTPKPASVAAGKTQQFTATGTYSNGTTQILTTTATWTSSATSIATVSSGGLATTLAQGSATITATSGAISGSATLTVTAAVLSSIAVSPGGATVAAGNTQQFTATGTYSNGTMQDLTSTASWTSSSTSVATIKLHTGSATSVAQGTTTITATSGSIKGTATMTVTAAALVSIAVTPNTASVAAGNTQQFTATGTYSNNTTQVLTTTATWTSSATSVATVSSGGLATSVAQGSSTITATSGTISGGATLTVTAAVLTSIAVTPTTTSVAAGNTQQFSATGTYSNGMTQNLTSTATWSSSATSVATVSGGGVATGVTQGNATITVTSGTISGSATLTVTAAVLTSIAVTPNTASVVAGNTQQFTATGSYSNHTTQDLTSTASWTSSATSIATVGGGGLATTLAQGSSTITATLGTISGSATLTVTAAVLTSLAVTPSTASISKGTTEQFTATGTYSDNSTQDLTSTVTWSSSTNFATITANGLATGVSLGSATITATSGAISGSATLTIGQATLVSLTVTPVNPSFALGTTQQLTATGTYSDGSTLDLTATATWSSANQNTATVDNKGIATSVALGSTSITAASGAISGSTTATITPAVLLSIAVTPAVPTLPLGTTQQFTATGSYTDGSVQNITATVQWTSDTTNVATIVLNGTNAGLASTLTEGSAMITATSGSVTGTTKLTVTAAALVSLAITPATPSIAKGTSLQFTATGTYTDGSTQNLTSIATWSSDIPATATINKAGLAQSVATGTTNITATSGTISNSTQLTVTEATLVSIAINPPTATVPKGATQQFTATGTYTDASKQDLTQSDHWSSTDGSVATISNTAGTAGLASTLKAGTTTINITSGSVTGTATMVVNAAALVTIAISPQARTIALGTTQQFTATGTYTDNSTQDLTSVVTWTSSDAGVAIISNTVGSYGLATSSGQGPATISATSSSISAATMLTVAGPALVSIALTPTSASIPAGMSQQFTATGNYTNGSMQDLTASATWLSSSPTIASANVTGFVVANQVGNTNITASVGSVTGSAGVTVTMPVLVSLAVTPESASIAKGTSQQFTATGTYSDNSVLDLTSTVSWISSLTSTATITASGLATGAGIGTSTITVTLGSIIASATLAVGQPTLSSIAVTPSNPSFAVGTTQQLTATGTYSDGSTLDLTKSATWSTQDSSIATVDNQGIASSRALGNTTVTATSGAITDSTTLNVTPAVLVSIALTPAAPTLPLGATQQFTATGTYTDTSTQNITGTVQWSSDTPRVATISGTTAGLASTIAQGTATITATSGSVTASTTLTVTAAALVSIAISPATPSIANGTTQQFTATGTYTDGNTHDLTSTATWTSDTPETATINSAGLAQSAMTGTAMITATSGTTSGSTLLAVTEATLVSIAVTPATATIAAGTTQQFTAIGTYSDNTTHDLTQSGHWSSTAAGVATISNTTGTAGLASATGTGTTTIGISSGSVSGTATLVVNPAALVSIAISPQSPTIALGTTQQFTATGTYTDGSTGDVTSVVTWISSNAMVAIIGNAVGTYGLATSSGQGAATISATSNSINASTTITVGQANFISISVAPASIAIALGYSEQFSATAMYSDNSMLDITQSAIWTSSSPNVAAINTSGYATSVSPGSTTISASSGSLTGTASLAVNAAVPISLAVTPFAASVFVGAQQQFTATLSYSDGSSVNVTSTVTWSSLNPAVANVTGSGLAVGLANGSSAIEAVWGANLLTATGTLTVSAPTVLITPAAASIGLSATQQFTATVTGNANQSVAWSVDGVAGGNSTIGTISTAGLYIAPPLIGSHTITAAAQANSASVGTATLAVGTLVPVQNTFFGIHLHLLTSPVPNTMQGTARIWDSASAQWPYLHTSMNTFVWTNLDNVLADFKTAGINDVLYTLWRVPKWASSNPTDASCDYASSLGSNYYGECDLPTDINADGTGTNLTWRTWVQNIAQHVNSGSYLATHAHISYWEPCNECYRSPTLDPGYGTGGAQVAYKGSFNQLVRLMQDARCIILGHPNDPITALNTTCAQAGYSVIGIDPTAQMVMPSTNPIQVGKNNPSYPQVMQNLLYCTCANNSCSASVSGCTSGSAGSAAVDIISTHIYPSTYTPEQIPSQIAKVRAELNPTDLAKPLWNGEGGWGQNTTATQVSDGDPDMEAAFVARFEVMTWASGIIRSYWYEWDNASYGTLWSSTSKGGCSTAFTSGFICKAGIAYQQVHDWLLGSTMGACSVTGTVWTCSLTQSNGSQAEIIWDTSQTCSNGTCSSTQQTVPSIYLHYSDLSGASFSANGTVPVGIKPILLKSQ